MARTLAPRVLQAITETPWALPMDWVDSFRSVAQLVHRDGATAESLREEIRSLVGGLAPERAIAPNLGMPLEGAQRATVRDGVAILTAMGPLFHYANLFTELCGATAYEVLASDLLVALQSPDVHAILLEVDSPGGEVAGCSELAQMIYAARGEKPLVTYVSALGCSGGYWLASAGEEVVIADTAILGSVGTVATYRVRDKGAEIEIVSSQSPKKRLDPASDAGRAEIQQMVDDLAAVFVATVARNRGRDEEDVLQNFGQGGVMVGQRAIQAGLADRLGSFESVLAELAERARARTAGGGGLYSLHSSTEHDMPQETTTTPAANPQPAPITAELITREHPQVAEQLRTAGATAERERIFAIGKLTIVGHEALIRQCQEDPACTEAIAAVKLVQAQQAAGAAERTAGQRYLGQLDRAEQQLDAPTAGAEDTSAAQGDQAQAARIINAGRRPALTE